jgi:hypothetical protein
MNWRDLKAMDLEQIEVLSCHLPGEGEENHKKDTLRYMVIWRWDIEELSFDSR